MAAKSSICVVMIVSSLVWLNVDAAISQQVAQQGGRQEHQMPLAEQEKCMAAAKLDCYEDASQAGLDDI